MLINGHNLNVETYGPANGPAVVLLHHGLGSIRAWKANTPILASAGMRVIVYDRWGYGKSDPRPELGQPTFKADQADLLSLLDELQVGQAALVGHSDGGTIAMYFSAAHAGRVTKLVTVAAHIYVEPKMEPGLEMIRLMYENDPGFQRKFTRQHGEKAGQVFKNWYDGWLREENLTWDMRPLLGDIACPTLVIQGEQDEHATPQHARDITAAIPGAELWLAPGVGHMLPQEAAERFNPRLIKFLGRATHEIHS
jgi:pimeloyl-ACP methyl ester carboxylesterase